MDRYEFERHGQQSTSLPLSPTATTISSIFIPTFIHSEWITLMKSSLHYAYPIVLLAGIFFCLLTLLALVQNVYMTSKPYFFLQTLFDLIFLIVGVWIYLPNYSKDLLPSIADEKIYHHVLFYIVWFIVIWLFLISCLDHACTAIQSTGYNEKLFCTPCNSKNFIVVTIMFGIVFLGIVFSLPEYFTWERSIYTNQYRPTTLRKSFLYEHIYFWFLNVIFLFVPLFAIFVLMGTLIYTLCKKNEHYLLTSNGNHHGHYTIHYANPHETSLQFYKTRERENISKLFLFICFLHLILVLPFSLVIFAGKLFLREENHFIPKMIFMEMPLAYDLSLILFYIQILMKFFLLTIFSGNFRLCLKKLITCRCFCCCCRSSSMKTNENYQEERIYMK